MCCSRLPRESRFAYRWRKSPESLPDSQTCLVSGRKNFKGPPVDLDVKREDEGVEMEGVEDSDSSREKAKKESS